MQNEKAQRRIVYTPEFKRNLRTLSRRYRRIRSDLTPFLNALQAGETPGDRIQGTQYVVFKVRLKNSDARKGKRGGYRVIYALEGETIILVTLYSKSDQGDISAIQIRRILDEMH